LKSVPIEVDGNEKAIVTAICTVSKSGNKLPPIYVLKGVRESLRTGLQPVIPPSRVTVSPNGWTDEQIVMKYLSWISAVSNSRQIGIVLDSFRAHNTPQVRAKAHRLKIELIFVPRGRTGEYQPLNRSCFGPVKSISRRLWDKRPAEKWTREKAAELLEIAWSRVTRQTIQHGWAFQGTDSVETSAGTDFEEPTEETGDIEWREEMSDPASESNESEPSSSGAWEDRFA
jgi:hypothetical protein